MPREPRDLEDDAITVWCPAESFSQTPAPYADDRPILPPAAFERARIAQLETAYRRLAEQHEALVRICRLLARATHPSQIDACVSEIRRRVDTERR